MQTLRHLTTVSLNLKSQWIQIDGAFVQKTNNRHIWTYFDPYPDPKQNLKLASRHSPMVVDQTQLSAVK